MLVPVSRTSARLIQADHRTLISSAVPFVRSHKLQIPFGNLQRPILVAAFLFLLPLEYPTTAQSSILCKKTTLRRCAQTAWIAAPKCCDVNSSFTKCDCYNFSESSISSKRPLLYEIGSTNAVRYVSFSSNKETIPAQRPQEFLCLQGYVSA